MGLVNVPHVSAAGIDERYNGSAVNTGFDKIQLAPPYLHLVGTRVNGRGGGGCGSGGRGALAGGSLITSTRTDIGA
jgi:hypothetical protein